MLKTIVLEGQKILREKSQKINKLQEKEFKVIIKDLRQTLKKTKNGIGLAAPQIGVNQQIFVIDNELAKNLKIPDVFINPTITKKSFGKEKLEEGCLSVPEIYGFVKRYKQVTVEAHDENNNKFIITAKGLLSQIIQHEVDHLNGVLFIDKATNLEKLENRKSEL